MLSPRLSPVDHLLTYHAGTSWRLPLVALVMSAKTMLSFRLLAAPVTRNRSPQKRGLRCGCLEDLEALMELSMDTSSYFPYLQMFTRPSLWHPFCRPPHGRHVSEASPQLSLEKADRFPAAQPSNEAAISPSICLW